MLNKFWEKTNTKGWKVYENLEGMRFVVGFEVENKEEEQCGYLVETRR